MKTTLHLIKAILIIPFVVISLLIIAIGLGFSELFGQKSDMADEHSIY